MKKIKCKVCEYEFDAVKSSHYISREDGKYGLSAISGGYESKIYDTFDCPVCGCQVVIQERKRVYVSKSIEDIERGDDDGE